MDTSSELSSSSTLSLSDIERLQKLLANNEPGFWRNYPLLIAAAGFSLSLITGAASTYTSYRRDIHDQQAQLVATIQSIEELVVKQAELNAHNDGSPMQAEAAKLISSQETTMLRTGADLAVKLGTAATTSELVTLAEGLWNVGDFSKTEKLLGNAILAADNPSDLSLALKGLGWFKIRSSQSTKSRSEGDALYERATHLEKEFDLESLPNASIYLKMTGNLNWADALALFACKDAQEHFSTAAALIASVPNTPNFADVRNQEELFRKYGIGGISACMPLPDATTK